MTPHPIFFVGGGDTVTHGANERSVFVLGTVVGARGARHLRLRAWVCVRPRIVPPLAIVGTVTV